MRTDRAPLSTLTALAALSVAAVPGHATTFTNGEFVTYDQLLYGTFRGEPDDPTLDALLENN